MPHPYDNIPPMLKQRLNWVVWGVRDAPLKAPFNPVSLLSCRPSPAKAGICDTWSSYQTAVDCVEQGLAQGIGYEFDGSGDIYGVDLDHVINEDGVTPLARDIVGKLASYEEGAVIEGLNKIRTEQLQKEESADFVSDLMLKILQTPTRKARVRDDAR